MKASEILLLLAASLLMTAILSAHMWLPLVGAISIVVMGLFVARCEHDS